MSNIIKQYSKLDKDVLRVNRFVSVGRLSQEMVDFLVDKDGTLAAWLRAGEEIVFWKDRIQHVELHRDDFFSDSLFEQCLEDIPSIIKSPDYIGMRRDKGSLSFFRILSQTVVVVARITSSGKLSFRTMYTLTSAQLDDYVRRGNAWKYEV